MKQFKTKNFLSLILVPAMMISMAACTKNPDNNSQSNASLESTASEVVEVKDPFEKYGTEISLTSVKRTLADFAYPEGDTIDDNPYTRAYKDELGVNVEYLWITDQTQYNNKLNTSIVSGEIPDFFYCEADVFKNLSESDLLADLTTVYEQYASPRVKEMNASFEDGFNSAKSNDKLQALPLLGFGTISLPLVTWVRQDWMDSANLSFPDTMDGLYSMAEKFMEQHTGSYGFAVEKGLIGGFLTTLGFANAYHAYPTMWLKNTAGNITYGSIQPEVKQYLSKMKDLYSKGLIDQEFSVKDVNKVNEDIISGKVGIVFGPCWLSAWPLTDAVKSDPNAIWKPYPIPSSNDKPVQYQGGWPVNGYFVVNKNCKNPEAVIKMNNLYVKWDEERKFPAEENNNMNWQSSPIYSNNPMSDYEKYVRVSAAIDTRDITKLTVSDKGSYDLAIDWKDNKNADGYGTYFMLSSEGSYSVIKKLVDENRVLLTELRGAQPIKYSEIKATLDKLELDTFTKVVMGSSSIDEFDKFVEDWKTLGGTAATDAINSLYK